MVWHTRDEAAGLAGVDPGFVDRMVEFGIIRPERPGRYSTGDVRRLLMAQSLDEAGIRLVDVGAAARTGMLSLAFMDSPAYERFASHSDETFRQVSDRTGIPLELLMVIREAIGGTEPSPDDYLREDEQGVVPFIELQLSLGFRPVAIERLLRVHGESTRRIAESEGDWWRSEVIEPAMAAGKGADEIANPEFAERTTPLAEQAMLSIYHAQQARAWTANIIEGFEVLLERQGIQSRLERLPAICFLDITGYTRLTQERGDDAAADLASKLARLVERSSARHGGKPVKWLGDGVMFHFRDPGPGVRSALEMVDGLAAAGMPPAHVGIHSGTVLFQAGDYFGQTVNVASRIADYARPGEVLVSRAVADAQQDEGISFVEIGEVELKGVAGTTELLRAQPA